MPKYRMKIRGGYGTTPDGAITEWELPLDELEIGDDIPPDLYDAVAEVMNWVYSLAQEQ